MHAELILYNGAIHTMDPLHPAAEAVAVADGRILAVGQLEDVEATAHANTRRLDLAGRTLIPGFNDAHAHLWQIGMLLLAKQDALSNGAPPDDAESEAAILAAAKAFLRMGVTSLTEAGASPAQLDTYRRLAAERRMPLRVNVMACRYLDDGTKVPLPERFESNWLRVDTVRLVADGSLDRGEAALSLPYLPEPGVDPGASGRLRVTGDQMRAMIWDIHRAGLRAAIQATGDAAIEQVIEAIEYASKRLVSRMKHRIEGFGVPGPDHLRRCRFRISVVLPAAALHRLGSTTLKRVPPEKVSGLYPLRALLDAGLTAALGSGLADPAGANPLLGLKTAADRLNAEGVLIAPEQAVPVPETLPLVTLGGAVVAGEDHLKGSISPGKYADFAVLSGDPLRAPVERLTDLQVEMTLVNGQVVYTT